MRLLLDTHAFLWFVAGDTSVSLAARAAITDPVNQTYVSIASAWEVAIKVGLGKLTVDAPSVREFFGEQIGANGFARWRRLARTASRCSGERPTYAKAAGPLPTATVDGQRTMPESRPSRKP